MFSLQIDHEDQIVLVNPWYQVAVREADALLVGNIDVRFTVFPFFLKFFSFLLFTLLCNCK
jgi:hypothetical protein